MQENQSKRIRDCHQLYVCQETYDCATKSRCVACAYKVATFDVVQDIPFTSQVANVRPESCPRFKESIVSNRPSSNDHWLGFTLGMNILTIGDGDLSYPLALKTKLDQLIVSKNTSTTSQQHTNLVATSYESVNVLSRVYPNIKDTMRALTEGGTASNLQTFVRTEVDATQLEATLFSSSNETIDIPQSYHRIIWNFPCLAVPQGQDGQNEDMDENKALIRKFITNIVTSTVLHHSGELLLTHKTKPPFDQWEIIQQVQLAQQEVDSSSSLMRKIHLEYKGRVVFDKCLFPCYIPRKALDRKSFSYHDACIYIFGATNIDTIIGSSERSTITTTTIPNTSMVATSSTAAAAAADALDAHPFDILPLTPSMIDRIRQIHLMIATKRAYDKVDQIQPSRIKRKGNIQDNEGGKKTKRHKKR